MIVDRNANVIVIVEYLAFFLYVYTILKFKLFTYTTLSVHYLVCSMKTGIT